MGFLLFQMLSGAFQEDSGGIRGISYVLGGNRWFLLEVSDDFQKLQGISEVILERLRDILSGLR